MDSRSAYGPGSRVAQPRPMAAAAVLVLLCLAMFFSNLGAHDLWGPDEVRYALVAREMRESGQYVVPYLNGDVYLEKPPLQFWLTAWLAEAAGARLPGRGEHYEIWARLPSAAAALLTVLLTWRVAARRWDEWTGLVAGLVLATNVQFFWFGRNGALDLLLTACITVAIVCGLAGLEARRWWPPWILGVAGGIALGTLTKGPVAVLVPLVVLGSYAWSTKRTWRGSVIVLTAAVGGLLLVFPWWQAALERSGGEYGNLSELWRQTAGRAVDSYSHQKPFYHYAVGLMGEFLPWSVFLPGAVIAAWRARGTVAWSRTRLAWCWTIPPFLVFSAISGKRGQYLLPIFPGLAMLVAVYLRTYASDLRPVRDVRPLLVPILLLLALIVLAGVGLAVVPWLPLDEWYGLEALRAPAFGGGVALACLGIWALLHHLYRPPSRIIASIVVIMTLLSAFTAGVALPAGDRVKSARHFATMVRGFSGLNTPVVMFHSFRPDIAFYYGRRLLLEWPPNRIAAYAEVEEPMLAIMQGEDYERLRENIPPGFVLLFRERIGSRVWVLLSNTPPAT